MTIERSADADDLGSLGLVGALLGRLRDAERVDDAIAVALEVAGEYLGASAGVAWSRDPAGQWRLVGVRGELSSTAPVLREPELEQPGRNLAPAVSNRFGGADLLLPAGAPFFGSPLGALRLAGLPAEATGQVPETVWALLDVVAGVTGEVVRHLHDKQRLAAVAEVVGIGTWEWSPSTDTVQVDAQMYRHLGVDPDGFVHTLAGYLDRVHPEDLATLQDQVQAALREPDGSWHTVHRLVGQDGTPRWVEGRGEAVRDAEGEVIRLWGTSLDVTERETAARELAYVAEHDALTGLANRTAFHRHLRAVAKRAVPGTVVVALVDIDGFRRFNEQQGWAAGDALLRGVAQRLGDCQPKATLVARLGADEFALLWDDVAQPALLEELGETIAACASEPEPLRPDGQQPSLRVGVAANLEGVRSADELWRAASSAVEVAKNRTSGRSQVFDALQHGEALARLAMEADLRHTLNHGAIDIAYQPILALSSGRIVGFEALARWQRPGHGPVSPATFVPLAERAGLIGQLGQQVLEGACRQLSVWDEQHPTDPAPYVAVNLAAIELDDTGLTDRVQDVLDRCGLECERLVLEVTETAFAHDQPGVLARLFELQRRGVRVSIDDFGTGYSSLSRLRELPFDVLKIDRSFIKAITSRHTPTPILQALFAMATSLDLDVVAEGVETAAQVAALLNHDCGFAQGFLFSRPLPPDEVTPLLAGEVNFDPPTIAAAVPQPASSPRLEGLLDQLAHTSGPPSTEVLQETLAVLAELTSLDSVYVTKVDLGRDYQQILVAVNTGTPRIEPGTQIPWAETLCRRAIADGRQLVADAPASYPDADVITDLGIQTYLGVELHGAKGGLRGTLCGVAGTTTNVSQETVETFHWVARLIGDRVQHLQPDSS